MRVRVSTRAGEAIVSIASFDVRGGSSPAVVGPVAGARRAVDWYSLEIELRGGRVLTKLDGALAAEAADSGHGPARFGLVTQASESVSFDDFEARELAE